MMNGLSRALRDFFKEPLEKRHRRGLFIVESALNIIVIIIIIITNMIVESSRQFVRKGLGFA